MNSQNVQQNEAVDQGYSSGGAGCGNGIVRCDLLFECTMYSTCMYVNIFILFYTFYLNQLCVKV